MWNNTIILKSLCIHILIGISFFPLTIPENTSAEGTKNDTTIQCDFYGNGIIEVFTLNQKNTGFVILNSSNHGVIDSFTNVKTKVSLSIGKNKRYKGIVEKNEKFLKFTHKIKYCALILNFFEESTILYYWNGKNIVKAWLAD
ncbi:MAG: hypothetical protein JW795_08355 [Chitinivibrionales bacterium]|nr:hypothetical protein [Chitinivibrionales bacterium]